MAEKYKALPSVWQIVLVALTTIGIIFAINYVFTLNLFGVTILENSYFYILIAVFVSSAFLLYPARKGMPREKIPWYDVLLFLACLGTSSYFAWHGVEIVLKAWSFTAPVGATVCSVILWFLIIEAVRRAGGLPLALICLFFSFYPLFAPYMPAFLQGQGFSFLGIAKYHLLGVTSVLGIPTKVFGKLLIGFMIFGVALQVTGGGKFFINLANALLGHTRGGPAKVSVAASALFGSMSGSVISNVVTTGAMTIPTMKSTGYPPHFAGAVEACSSTGGVLMPPIMGATAFIIASFLNMPYVYICAAAVLPSILYYLGIFIQVDAYAAKTGLKGISRSELPSLWQTLKEGWFYILAFGVLIYLLIYLRREAIAPFYATALLFALCMIRKETRLTAKKFFDFLAGTGRLLTELMAILAAIGFIVGSLAVTGVGNSFAREIIFFAGGSLPLLLILCALTSFILGMGMTVTACYIFLAIVLAPALVKIGLYPLAVHLFVMYCGMISYITPPVALGAYAAAGIAGASPIKTGFQAMRLGIAIYFVPFFFVLNPALVLHGSPLSIVHAFFTCAIGIALIASASEGYLLGVGKLSPLVRPFIAISGILLGIPEWRTDAIGAVILAITLAICFTQRRVLKLKEAPGFEDENKP